VQRFLLWIDAMSLWVGKTFAWFILLLTAVTTVDVIMSTEYIRNPPGWIYDASVILYGTLFMMGGAYALSRNAHVRGDVFYRTWPVRRQALVDLLLYVLFFFPGILALVIAGAQFAAYSWSIQELSSQSARQIPIYHFKTVIPVAALFMLIQGVAETIRCVIALRTGVWPTRLSDIEETEKRLAEEAV
jgi:TRAP-type mannitol/chloroaromatic compound transport system permease small subunit